MAWSPGTFFGAGVLFMTPLAGGTPVRVGILQDVSLDISFDEKPLYGSNQWPVAVARGKAKGSLKAKTAQIDSQAIATQILGGTPLAGQNVIYDLEAHTVPASPSYTVTVSNVTGGISDKGVTYALTGQPLTQVNAGSEATGKYSVNTSTGVYTFAAGDASAAILISYINAASTGFITTINSQLMGTSTYFQADLYQTNPEVTGSQWGVRLYKCMSSKLTLATKQDDWIIPEFDASIQALANGKVADFNTPA